MPEYHMFIRCNDVLCPDHLSISWLGERDKNIHRIINVDIETENVQIHYCALGENFVAI